MFNILLLFILFIVLYLLPHLLLNLFYFSTFHDNSSSKKIIWYVFAFVDAFFTMAVVYVFYAFIRTTFLVLFPRELLNTSIILFFIIVFIPYYKVKEHYLKKKRFNISADFVFHELCITFFSLVLFFLVVVQPYL